MPLTISLFTAKAWLFVYCSLFGAMALCLMMDDIWKKAHSIARMLGSFGFIITGVIMTYILWGTIH